MFYEILRFELRQQWRAPLFWVFAVVFAGLGFGITASKAVAFGKAVGNVHVNAPMVIASLSGGLAVIGMLFVTVFVAGAVLRDIEAGTAEMLFATPVSRRAYLGGRFSAGVIVTLIIFASVLLGMALGVHMPWIDAQRLGPPQPLAYLWSLGVMVVPDVLFVSALLFALAAATRSLLSTFVGVLAFFVLRTVAARLMVDVSDHTLAALLDPFGAQAVEVVTRYWTAHDFNTRLPPVMSLLGINRLLWLGVSVVLAAGGFALFRPDREGLRLWPRRRRARVAAPSSAPATGTLALPPAQPRFGMAAQWRAVLGIARSDCMGVLRGVAFVVLALLTLGLLTIVLVFSSQIYGTNVYPVTRVMLASMRGAVTLPLWIVMAFYAGELVWRAREKRMSEVIDACPLPDWVHLAGKLLALAGVVAAFELIAMVYCIGYQLVLGFTHIEIGLYLASLALMAIPFVLVGALALVLQMLANNKFIGYLLIVLFFLSTLALGFLDLRDNLYQFASAPNAPYSDMNGFGHFLPGTLWFDLYWTLVALALLTLATALRARGTDSGWRVRLGQAGRRLRHAPMPICLTLALLGAAGCGGWIYYNTHVLNMYRSGDEQKQIQADYEKLYGKYADVPQPRITAVHTNVAIYPYQRRLLIHGTYTLTNKHAMPIDTLYLIWLQDRKPEFTLPPHETVKIDKRIGFGIYHLKQPIAPGASIKLGFVIKRDPKGFRNNASQFLLVHNGTFFTNTNTFPSVGYNPRYELSDKSDRKKYGLKRKPPMAPLDNQAARANTYISHDADWIAFDATVSTAADQIALAPGELEKTWKKNGRRYFHYTMHTPMQNFYAFLSARWKVRRAMWHDIPIQVYYDPAHPWNVRRMIDASKAALTYYTAHYTPYQYQQLRILEFPGYRNYAQSFAGTVPYSESVGFIADQRDKSDIDFPFYVTAHEVAHQWWGHQVVGADMQGSPMLAESLAQYSSLMVMKHTYGAHKIRRFLKYELDRYLAGRLTERNQEEPLAKDENQLYIHYRKGSLVFYALQDYIGEDTLDAILKQFLVDYGHQQPPYVTSRQFVQALKKGAGAKWDGFIDDLFWKITLYDNHVVKATAEKLDDGRYRVTLKLHAAKYYADGKGKQARAKLTLPIPIGIFASAKDGKEADEPVLYLKKRRVTDGDGTISIIVDKKPYEAGIDPYNELIDRNSSDNRMRVTVQ